VDVLWSEDFLSFWYCWYVCLNSCLLKQTVKCEITPPALFLLIQLGATHKFAIIWLQFFMYTTILTMKQSTPSFWWKMFISRKVFCFVLCKTTRSRNSISIILNWWAPVLRLWPCSILQAWLLIFALAIRTQWSILIKNKKINIKNEFSRRYWEHSKFNLKSLKQV